MISIRRIVFRLSRLFRAERLPTHSVQPMTFSAVDEQRQRALGHGADRTPCSCPACRRSRRQSAA